MLYGNWNVGGAWEVAVYHWIKHVQYHDVNVVLWNDVNFVLWNVSSLWCYFLACNMFNSGIISLQSYRYLWWLYSLDCWCSHVFHWWLPTSKTISIHIHVHVHRNVYVHCTWLSPTVTVQSVSMTSDHTHLTMYERCSAWPVSNNYSWWLHVSSVLLDQVHLQIYSVPGIPPTRA